MVILRLLGVDVIGWLQDVWTQIKDVPLRYLVLGGVLQMLQTSLNGLAYYGILAYAYPDGAKLWPIITAYAVGVSMNNFLPANIGTFVTLLMFVAIIPGSTFPGILAAYMVNKIFFTIVGGLVYLYLFLEAGAAFDVELGWFRDHRRRCWSSWPAAPSSSCSSCGSSGGGCESSGRRRRRAGRSSPPPAGSRPVSCCRSSEATPRRSA